MLLARLLLELVLIPGVFKAADNQPDAYPALACMVACVFLIACALVDASLIVEALP